jgi:hypothetical protein
MGSYSHSLSSLSDVPAAPYPLSFSVAPMANQYPANQPALPGPTYGHAGSVYAPHTLIRSPASMAAGMQAS